MLSDEGEDYEEGYGADSGGSEEVDEGGCGVLVLRGRCFCFSVCPVVWFRDC